MESVSSIMNLNISFVTVQRFRVQRFKVHRFKGSGVKQP
jgi:hypothetical protein